MRPRIASPQCHISLQQFAFNDSVGDVSVMSLIDFLRTMPDPGDDRIFRRPKRKPRKVTL
jgi:hypothetical protein